MRKAARQLTDLYKQRRYVGSGIIFVDPIKYRRRVAQWHTNGPVYDPHLGLEEWPAVRFLRPAQPNTFITDGDLPDGVAPDVPNKLPPFGSVYQTFGARIPTFEVLAQLVFRAVVEGGGRPGSEPPVPMSIVATFQLVSRITSGEVKSPRDRRAKDLLRQGANIDAGYIAPGGDSLLAGDSVFHSAVHVAARHANILHLRRLLNFGADIDARDEYNRTLLHHCLAAMEVVDSPEDVIAFAKAAVELGADPNAIDRNGETPCGLAQVMTYASGNREAPKVITEAGFEFKNPFNAFCAALWELGANMDAVNDMGQHVIMQATASMNSEQISDNVEFLEWVLGDPDGPRASGSVTDVNGDSLIALASVSFPALLSTARTGISLVNKDAYSRGHILHGAFGRLIEEDRLLHRALGLKTGGKKRQRKRDRPKTSITTGVVTNNQIAKEYERDGSFARILQSVLVLCELLPDDFSLHDDLGANGRQLPSVDFSDLYEAASERLERQRAAWDEAHPRNFSRGPHDPQWEGSQLALWNDLRRAAKPGESPREAARRLGFLGSRGLANSPCGINDLNNQGDTSLVGAIRGNSGDIARLLLAAGADPNLRMRNGLTALHVAAGRGAGRAARAILQSKRTDVLAKDDFGRTAIDVALSHGQVVIAEAIRASARLRARVHHATDGDSDDDDDDDDDELAAEELEELLGRDILHEVSSKSLAKDVKDLLDNNGYVSGEAPAANSVLAAAAVDLTGERMGTVGSFPSLAAVAATWARDSTPSQNASVDVGAAGAVPAVRRLAGGPPLQQPYRDIQAEWDSIVHPDFHENAERLEQARGPKTPYCEVDVVDASEMTPEKFADYVMLNRPVLIRGGVNGTWDIDAFRPSKILSLYGETPVNVGGVPYSREFGQQQLQAPVGRFLKYLQTADPTHLQQVETPEDQPRKSKAPDRWSGSRRSSEERRKEKEPARMGVVGQTPDGAPGSNERSNGGLPPPVFDGWDHHKYPLYLSDASTYAPWHRIVPNATFLDKRLFQEVVSQFFTGPPTSGAPIHYHHNAMNFMLVGRKRWFVLPPADSVYSSTHITRWFDSERETQHKTRRPLECVQEAGDSFFVPLGWAHGVLNLRYSAAVAIEFAWRYAHMQPELTVMLPDKGEYQRSEQLREFASFRLPMHATR